MLPESRSGTLRVPQFLMSLLLCGALSGCGVSYLAQATQGQWQLMRARRPIDRVIEDPSTTSALKSRLELVLDARDFASSALALPNNRSYRSYADLKRPYVVWNVVAAPEFSIEPRRWCFPFTGCLSYRGYFRESAARAFAARLAGQGDDTLVAGVAAYSTLGHFADPVLSTMMRYGDLEMVSTIFHELAHQVIYFKGETQFNESFAVTVEQEGLRRWLVARGRSAELASFLRRRDADRQFTRVLAEARRALGALYREPLAPEALRSRKHELLTDVGAQVRALEASLGQRSGYDPWIDAGLNNAHLASIATYSDCVPGFQRLLERQGGDLPAFYSAVRSLRHDRAAREALCRPAVTASATTMPRP